MITHTTGTSQCENCISLGFNFHSVSGSRYPRKLEPQRLTMISLYVLIFTSLSLVFLPSQNSFQNISPIYLNVDVFVSFFLFCFLGDALTSIKQHPVGITSGNHSTLTVKSYARQLWPQVQHHWCGFTPQYLPPGLKIPSPLLSSFLSYRTHFVQYLSILATFWEQVGFMVFHTTCNNSFQLYRGSQVSLVEETGVTGKNHRTATNCIT